MKRRSHKQEMLDEETIPEKDLHASLAFMRFVNHFFGGTRVILDYFSRHPVPERFRVLDLGTGGGDIPFALSRWAEAHGKRAEITAVDVNPASIAYAQKRFSRACLRYVQASAFDLNKLGEFDFIISSMFFHHLTDDEIVRLLVLMRQSARMGFVVNDLYRSWPAYVGARVLSGLSFQKSVIHDAALSVKRAFRREDFLNYGRLSKLPHAKIERKPMFRIVLSHYA